MDQESDHDDDDFSHTIEVVREKQKWLIYPTNKFKYGWDILIIILLVYTALYVPYKVCFIDISTNASFIFDLIVDACFCTDIIITFFTAKEAKEGHLIIDKKIIAHNYLRGWFTIDLFTSIPFQIIEKLSVD
jgi:hypothetical protein